MNPLSRHRVRATDLPLWFWALGYAEFVLQVGGLDPLPLGFFTIAGSILLFSLAVISGGKGWREEGRKILREWLDLLPRNRPLAAAYFVCFCLFAAELALGFFSSLKPPHLPQEFDAIHYQMGVPHQLLLAHSFSWISWSVADLWPMAMQWGLSPLSFAFTTVNKLSQFFVVLGIAPCLYRIARLLDTDPRPSRLRLLIPALALFSAHGVMIQIGSGMMDLPLIYFLLAGLLAFLENRLFVCALALSVFAASKAFHPFYVGAIVAGGLVWLLARKDFAEARRILLRLCLPLALFTFSCSEEALGIRSKPLAHRCFRSGSAPFPTERFAAAQAAPSSTTVLTSCLPYGIAMVTAGLRSHS